MNRGPILLQDLGDCRDKALAGGKAVNLGVLIRAGFPVPGGFVITAEAYRHARSYGSPQMPESLAEEIRKSWRAMGAPAVAVRADVAGVLFSANPQTGSRCEMLIEASWGLGESVVSGRVQPDVLKIETDSGRVLAATISDKQIWIKPGEEDEKPVEEDRRRVP